MLHVLSQSMLTLFLLLIIKLVFKIYLMQFYTVKTMSLYQLVVYTTWMDYYEI